jgi:adenylate cyclase
LPAVFEREQSGHGAFLTELRPVGAIFLRFTGIDYDAEAEAGSKLDNFMHRVQSILTRYEGTLVQLTIGDKGSYLYATFGAPTAHEDDACCALYAALDLRRTAAELDFLAPVQIGISQGIMRTGAYGSATRRTYGVLGDDVNLAAHLMSVARPGEILVSPRVQKNLSATFTFRASPRMPIKGKTEPMTVFAVAGQRRKHAIHQEEPYYALPMLGRQAELTLIEAKLELALQGKGQVIGVTVEAGMGKSRLVAEVIRLAIQRGFIGYGGACEASGANTPYLVWKSIWQALFEVTTIAPTAEQIRQIEKKCKRTSLCAYQRSRCWRPSSMSLWPITISHGRLGRKIAATC